MSPAARALAIRSAALNARYGLTKRFAPPTPKVTPSVTTTRARPAAPAAPKTLAEQAAEIAALSIDPQKKAVADEIARMEGARTSHLQAVQGVANALTKMTGGDAAATRDAYQQAADRIAGYAKGFTGELRDTATDAAGKVATLMSSLGLEGTVKSGGDAAANVAYLLGGTIPAGDLAAEGARSVETVTNQRAAVGARLADEAGAADFKAGQDVTAIRGKLEEIEAKRPGLILEALQSLTQQQNAKRATDTQIGYLQLQQAKTASDQALAWTNITGTIHIVGKGGKIIDTGKSAAGSDAATIAAANRRSAAATAASRANAKLSARTRKEIADAANQAKAQAAATSADARIEAARVAAEAKKEAARISAARKAGDKTKPTAKQRADIIKGATASGTTVVTTTYERIWNMTPGHLPQQKNEDLDDYTARRQRAIAEFRKRLKQHRAQIVRSVRSSITPQLKVIGYKDAEIQALAETIVEQQIPKGVGGSTSNTGGAAGASVGAGI